MEPLRDDRGRRRGFAVISRAGGIAATLLVCALSLSACAVRPAPLTPGQTALRIETDRRRLAANRPSLDRPLTLHQAMAHALLHNLDARVRALEHDLALGHLDVARLGLLPPLTARYGVTSRSNAQASSSRSVFTGRESLSASTSTDDTRRTGSLTAVWRVLDFGVSWYAAKQQSDRALIAHERRRKAVQTMVQEVRGAWWRAVASERALARVDPLMGRVRAALADSARLAGLRVRSPLEALRYQRALLEALQALELQRREGRLAKIELAELIGLAPGTDYRLAMPGEPLPEPRSPTLGAGELETLALAYRPELREAQLDERIAAGEVKKALLRVLPGLELSTGANLDSNSFLVNNHWASLGAAVSLNLAKIFTAPAAIDAARAGEGLARARREALSMAVLAQLYVALAGFEEARAHHATTRRIAETQMRIAEVLRSSGRRGVVNELQLILGELNALRSELARDLSYAEIENGFGRIFVAAGADIVPDGAAAPTLEGLAEAIATTEDAWMRGAVAMRPYREERTHKPSGATGTEPLKPHRRLKN